MSAPQFIERVNFIGFTAVQKALIVPFRKLITHGRESDD